MKVKFLKSPTGAPFFLGYSKGQTANVSDEVGVELIEAKIAEAVESGKPEKATDGKAAAAEKKIAAGGENAKKEPAKTTK